MEQKQGFKPGKSGNPKGRPVGSGRPISRLRSTLNKLKHLEPDAIEIIERVITGDKGEVDEQGQLVNTVTKEQLDTAKWVISTINTLTRGAIAEETYKLDVKTPQTPQAGEATGTTDSTPKRYSVQFPEEE